jgi:DNA-binding transcriptional LysR family regulator
MEEELGVSLFERLPQGVRLTSAGELFLQMSRMHLADLDRVKSQIADLKGVRRGHISIACSQALLSSFIPQQVAKYRSMHPGVTFSVLARDRSDAVDAVINMQADLAVVFEPTRQVDFQVIHAESQPIYAILSADHPLSSKTTIRLGECLNYDLALPKSTIGVRYLLEDALKADARKLEPVLESDSFETLRYYARYEQVITFQIAVGLPEKEDSSGLVYIPLDQNDVNPGIMYVGQLRHRALPVAAAKFANQLSEALDETVNTLSE